MHRTLTTVLLLTPLACWAEPLLTIACDPPKGLSQRYGINDEDRMKTSSGAPAPHLLPAEADGYAGKPLFVIDSSKRKLTAVWSDMKEGEQAREVPIIEYSPTVVTALDAHPGNNGLVSLYSFYPKLGIMLWSLQYSPPLIDSASQSMLFAKCRYSWSGKP